jgi:hypothetical protein
MRLVATAALVGGLLIAGGANATVFFTEDFSGYDTANIAHGAHAASSASGNTITTDYGYRVPNGQNQYGQPDSMYDEGTWTIGTNPIDVHNLWIDAPQNNPFLMLNGATENSNPPPVAYESKSISVGPGTYTYSYDLLNLCCNANGPAGTPSLLQLWYLPGNSQTPINIVPLSQTASAISGWEHISGTFAIGAGGSLRLGLSDLTNVASGNDFGVDNISLASGAPEPAEWSLMIMGFGAAGAMLRRRTRVLA